MQSDNHFCADVRNHTASNNQPSPDQPESGDRGERADRDLAPDLCNLMDYLRDDLAAL